MIGTIGPSTGEQSTPSCSATCPGLAAIDEHRGRIGERVVQPAGLRHRLGEREPPRAKCKLPLLSGCAECQERPRLREYVDGILRANIDVVRRFVDERAKRRGRLASIALERHERVVARILRTAGAGDCIEQPVAACVHREARRCVDLAEHADGRRPLVDEPNHRLRFDRAILQRVRDGLLDLDDGASLGRNAAGIGHGNVAVGIDRWFGRVTKLPGRTPASMRDEQAAGGRLEYRHADDIADAEPDFAGTATVREHLSDSRRMAFARISSTSGVMRTRLYGKLSGSSCPASTYALAGPAVGSMEQPPWAKVADRAIAQKTLPRNSFVSHESRSRYPSDPDLSFVANATVLCHESRTPD